MAICKRSTARVARVWQSLVGFGLWPCCDSRPRHSPNTDYINFLRGVTPNIVDENMTQLRRFNMGIAGEADCPVFDGLYEYCQVSLQDRTCLTRAMSPWRPR